MKVKELAAKLAAVDGELEICSVEYDYGPWKPQNVELTIENYIARKCSNINRIQEINMGKHLFIELT